MGLLYLRFRQQIAQPIEPFLQHRTPIIDPSFRPRKPPGFNPAGAYSPDLGRTHQSEQDVDSYCSKLTAGGWRVGMESQCGWLKDKIGLCWQTTSAPLPDLLNNPRAIEARGA